MLPFRAPKPVARTTLASVSTTINVPPTPAGRAAGSVSRVLGNAASVADNLQGLKTLQDAAISAVSMLAALWSLVVYRFSLVNCFALNHQARTSPVLMTKAVVPVQVSPESEEDECFDCPKEYHTQITEFLEHGQTYFMPKYLESKKNWPEECIKCHRTFVTKKPTDDVKEVQVTSRNMAMFCPNAKDDEHTCVFAYCFPCYGDKLKAGTPLTDPPSPWKRTRQSPEGRKREGQDLLNDSSFKRSKRAITPRRLVNPGEKLLADGSVVPLEASQAKTQPKIKRGAQH
jgi:hypothetical protein